MPRDRDSLDAITLIERSRTRLVASGASATISNISQLKLELRAEKCSLKGTDVRTVRLRRCAAWIADFSTAEVRSNRRAIF